MKHITIQQRNGKYFCCIDGIPAGPMYDVFDRGVLRHYWPYKAGNNGHEKLDEAVDYATKLRDYFNEVNRDRDKLITAAAGKNASARFWGGAKLELQEDAIKSSNLVLS